MAFLPSLGQVAGVCPHQQERLYPGSSFCWVVFKLSGRNCWYRFTSLCLPLPGGEAFFPCPGESKKIRRSSSASRGFPFHVSFKPRVSLWRLSTMQWRKRSCLWVGWELEFMMCLKSSVGIVLWFGRGRPIGRGVFVIWDSLQKYTASLYADACLWWYSVKVWRYVDWLPLLILAFSRTPCTNQLFL